MKHVLRVRVRVRQGPCACTGFSVRTQFLQPVGKMDESTSKFALVSKIRYCLTSMY